MAINEETAQVLRIATARIGYDRHGRSEDDRVLDITVKSASEPVGELMAPEWKLVLDLKEERIDWGTYGERYRELLRKRYAGYGQAFIDLIRDVIAEDKRLVLTCYCNTNRECHRFLMADILEKIALSEGYEVSQEGELERRATPAISPLRFGNAAVPFQLTRQSPG